MPWQVIFPAISDFVSGTENLSSHMNVSGKHKRRHMAPLAPAVLATVDQPVVTALARGLQTISNLAGACEFGNMVGGAE